MIQDDSLVGFATFTERDCIKDDLLYPWIGFVFVDERYRGNRYSDQLIGHICQTAANLGCNKVYLATDHIGFYEKYGFSYLESRINIYGEESHIYSRKIEG